MLSPKCRNCMYISDEPIDRNHHILKRWYRCMINPNFPMAVCADGYCRTNFAPKAEMADGEALERKALK